MPLVLADRVNETTTTTSTGTLTLAGAVSGYQSFAVIGNGNTTYYTIVHQTANEWEVGIGTYTSSGTLLSRDTVLASSNSGSLVNFSAGTKFVFCDYPAGRAVYLDTATNVTIPGLTLSGGTANGVLYLNGSKVATSGSALTFNGTTLVSPDITDSSLTSGRVTYAGTGGNFVDSANLTFNGTTLVAADLTDSSLTSGRVVFSGAGGNLSDSSSLTWNGTGLGVGASSAGVRLDVQSSVGGTPGFASNTARFISTATAGVGVGASIVLGGKTNNLTADYAFAGLQGVKESATASNYAGSLLFLTQNSVGSTSLSEHMRLLSTGDFGIGTAAPNYKLDVRGTIATGNGTVRMALSSTAADGITGTLSNHGLFFYTNNTARGYFDTSGNLGLGTTSPGQKLTVAGGSVLLDNSQYYYGKNAAGSAVRLLGVNAGNVNYVGAIDSGPTEVNYGAASTITAQYWNISGSEGMRLNATGLGIGTASPAYKLDVERSGDGITAGIAGGTYGIRFDNGGTFSSGMSTIHGVDSTLTASYQPIMLNGATVRFGISATEVARFDTAGRFLLGASSNTSRGGANTTALFYKASGTQYLDIQTGTSGDSGIVFSATSSSAYGLINYSNSVNAMLFYANSAEVFRITSSGLLGLGTTTPAAELHVVNSTPNSGRPTALFDANYGNTGDTVTGLRLNVNAGAGGGYQWGYSTESVLAHNMEFISGSNYVARSTSASNLQQTGGSFIFFSNQSLTAGSTFTPTERMRLDTSGNLGIGATSPVSKLDVRGVISGGDGTIRTVISYTASAGVTGTLTNHPYVFYANNAEAARFDTSGNFAIAQGNSPTQVLSLYRGGSTNAIMSAGNSNTGLDGTWFGVDTAGNGIVNVRGAFPLIFSTSALERARIDSSGRILVNTTNTSVSAGAGFKVLPNENGTNAPQIAIVTPNTTLSTASLSIYSTGAAAFRFYVVDSGTIYATSTTITGISDRRVKENIVDLDVGLNAVMALKPRKFDWKAGKGKDIKGDRGFVAQEFEEVFPDLVDTWKDPAPEGEEPYKALRQDLIPVLVKAIQEQQAMIEELKAEVSALKGVH